MPEDTLARGWGVPCLTGAGQKGDVSAFSLASFRSQVLGSCGFRMEQPVLSGPSADPRAHSQHSCVCETHLAPHLLFMVACRSQHGSGRSEKLELAV